MNDLKPFVHGSEGTHSCCPARIRMEGGKARCCECVPHEGCSSGLPDPIEQRSQVPYDRRPEVLEYYVTHGRKAMIKNYNMTQQAASHLIYHDKKLIEAIEDEHFEEAGL